jgi:hypothetical protein
VRQEVLARIRRLARSHCRHIVVRRTGPRCSRLILFVMGATIGRDVAVIPATQHLGGLRVGAFADARRRR